MSVRPLIVVGSLRSGTTLAGTLLGSAPGVADLGEYPGYDFCYEVAPQVLAPMPTVTTDAYLAELRRHAHEFPKRWAEERTAGWFVTSAPQNLRAAAQIQANEPDAVFVLCKRDVRGVCQSLQRSYEGGRSWLGRDTRARLDLWCRYYSSASSLPPRRTVVMDYDELCASPEAAYEMLCADLARFGFPIDSIDRDPLTRSHATDGERRPTSARRGSDGAFLWQSRPAYDPGTWTPDDEATVESHPEYGRVKQALDEFVRMVRAEAVATG